MHNWFLLEDLDLDTVLINDAISSLDMLNSGVIFEFEGHDFKESFFETLELLNKIFLLLLDNGTFFLLKRPDFLFESQHQLFTFTEFLFGLVNKNNIDFVFFQWDLMLFKKLNHSLNLGDKNLNLGSEFFVVTDDLHDLSEEDFVFGMVIWINSDTFLSVFVKVLEVGKNNLNLVQEESSVDINPFLDFNFQRVS